MVGVAAQKITVKMAAKVSAVEAAVQAPGRPRITLLHMFPRRAMGMTQISSLATSTSRLQATETPTYGTTELIAAATTAFNAKATAAAGGRSPSKWWIGVLTGAAEEEHSISPKRPSAPSRTRVWVSSLSPTPSLFRTRVTKSTRCRLASTSPLPITQAPCHINSNKYCISGHGMRCSGLKKKQSFVFSQRCSAARSGWGRDYVMSVRFWVLLNIIKMNNVMELWYM